MKNLFLLIVFLINVNVFSQRNTSVVPSTPGFHDTQGRLEISNNGQATYVLPIALPPSIQNVGPTINMVYSSGQFGGVAGQGWNINSISTISRVATRKDIDGFVDGVDFDNNDKLALDGQRLILVSGAYWANNSVYKTEVLSNSKIELKGSGSSTYFIVTAPDGSRSWYGNFGGQNAEDLTAYYIVRFEDTNGNFITYHYNKPFNKSLCINEIKFSANVNGLTTPLNRIKFNYVEAERIENAYIKGVKLEKVELLKSIFVYTNSMLFRKYILTHDVIPQLGYERVVSIQEYNSNNEAANPIVFEYNTTTMDSTGSESMTTYNNNLNFEDIELSGDFDGDGRLDFTTQNGLYRNLFNGSIGQVPVYIPPALSSGEKKFRFTAITLNNNKLNQFQSIVKVEPLNDGLKFRVFNFNNTTLYESYSKTINLGTPTLIAGNDYSLSKFLEGDFNGDGVSEVLIISTPTQQPPPDPTDPCHWFGTCGLANVYTNFHILDLNHNSSTNIGSQGLVKLNSLAVNSLSYNKNFVYDFNGDGKADILSVNDNELSSDYGKYIIYTFNQMTTQPWITTETLGVGQLDKYSKTKQILFGDFNGDGKTDIMLPDTEGGSKHTLWHIYYSNPNPNGGSFFVKESHNIVEYWPNTGTPGTPGAAFDKQVHFNSYYALDTNGDGKSDIVRIWRKHYKVQGLFSWNDHNTQWIVTSFVNNIGNTQITGNKFQLDYQTPCQGSGTFQNCNHNSDSPSLIIPVVSSYRHGGINQDLVVLQTHYNQAYFIKFKKDVAEDIRISKVTSSGGNIVDQIEYARMHPSSNLNNGQGALTEFYSSNNSLNYPFVEIKRLTDNFLVSKLTNTTDGVTKHQDFNYHGLVFNLYGLGIIGFNKTARSAWYQNSTAKRLWNVYEYNSNWRGALSRSYSQLINPGTTLFSFVNSGNPNGIVNSTTNNFTSYNANGSYYLVLLSQTVRDFITTVSTETTYNYDNFMFPTTNYTYLLPTTITTKNFTTSPLAPIGTKVTHNVFENNPSGAGTDYHIGRPLEVTSSISAYGNTSTSKEIFTYTGNKLTKSEKKGNTTDSKFLVEEFEYNNVGNVTKKTLSSTGYNTTETFAPRVTEYTYDPTERFVKTSKDIEGLIATNVSYHPIYGIVTETLSPYGLTSKVLVDHWGKPYRNIDYLGNNTNLVYSKTGNEYTISKTHDDGSESVTISDALGRPKKSGQKNIDGSWFYSVVEYDFLGRKFKESEPFSSGSPSQWKTTTFDDYGRQKTVQYPSGLTTTLTYSGLTVTGTDGFKTTSSTKNANGHVVSSSDNGGTITYEYYAHGSLKNSNYSGTKVEMEYDEWGRKKKLKDPSAGEYTYSYNAIGELLTETTPNGTTSFIYDDFGNIMESTIEGANTDSKTTYTYDNNTKLLATIRYEDFNNGGAYDEYSYDYDSFKRLYVVTENKFGNFYQRVTLFDGFGRPFKESYNAIASGKQSAKWIRNTYKNGYHWQILDDATNQVLWQTNTVNEKGQLLSAALGNGIAITNTYDSFGFPTQFKHDKTGQDNVMTLNTTFDAQRGNLTSRYNSLFYWNENFQYDNLDRLTHYTNIKGQQVNQIYETDGRILENDLGSYNYDNSVIPPKKYQNTSIDLTSESKSYYENRLGVFNDGMETKQGWLIYEPSMITYDENVSYSGNVSLKIANTTTSEKIVNSDVWTKIDNAVPTQYTYSAWVKSDGTNPQAQIFLFMKTENETGYYTLVDNRVMATSTNWVLMEKTFTVPAHIKKISIRLDNNATGNLWFDDVRIRKTSNPISTTRALNISYNTWKSPYQIEETHIDKISFTYNYMNNRSNMYYGGMQNLKHQRQYHKSYSADGTMEVTKNNLTNEVEFVTFLGGDAYSAPVVLKSDGTTQNFLYLHRDYLGSIVAITNQEGNVVEKRLFDAWGEVIKAQDGQGNALNGFKVLDRGYTGHEHLHSVNLIHMNGRLYDAKLHRFLQPDNYIQDPYNTQNYNRYGYVLNNPLKYTDPSGELISFGLAVGIGAFIAATTYSIQAGYTYGFQASGWGFLKAVIIGAASSAVTYGIGDLTKTMPFAEKIVAQAFAHGTSQAFFTGIQGGDPMVGFASGALSSIASSLWSGGGLEGEWQGFGGDFANKGIGILAFGTVAGGAGASLTGGNFWRGAATGLVVSGLNHFAHSGDRNKTSNEEDNPPKYKYKDKIYDDKAKLYSDILLDQFAEQFGIKDLLALGAALDYAFPSINKPFTMPDTSPKSTYASKYGEKLLPQKMPIRLPTHIRNGSVRYTNVLGRFLGRVAGPIGWGILAYDISMTFYNTQVIYNRITQ